MERKSLLNLSFFNFALIVFFAVETNYDWNRSQILHWGALALLLIAYIFKNGGIIDLKFRDYSWWMGGILVISCISCIYSINIDNSVTLIKTLVVMFVAFFMIRNYMTDYDRIKQVLADYNIALFITMIYVLFNVDLELIGEVQLGTQVIEGWNGNAIGLMAASGTVISIYMLFDVKKLSLKLLYIIQMALFIYVVVYTGSRTSILFIIASVLLLVFFRKPTAIVKNALITILIIWVLYFVCMNVESVYNILGIRLEGLFASFTGEGEVDLSTLRRMQYIENGWKWVKESPIIGYGVDSYRALNGPVTGRFTYSHNNFIEILINWGIIGFTYYYGFYLWIANKLRIKGKSNILAMATLAILISYTVAHYGNVSYYEIWQNLLLCVACAAINCKEGNEYLEANSDD